MFTKKTSIHGIAMQTCFSRSAAFLTDRAEGLFADFTQQ
jgi:hypothetical protein